MRHVEFVECVEYVQHCYRSLNVVLCNHNTRGDKSAVNGNEFIYLIPVQSRRGRSALSLAAVR